MNAPHKHGTEHHQQHSRKRPIHKDWRLWVGVGCMLLAMLAYVLTFDESIEPESNTAGERVPAAAGP
jgi:hypothetical protein